MSLRIMRRMKARAAKMRRQRRAISFGGVIVSRTDVRRHRYLRDHGLPHSASLASVFI